jgi:hypothetical protein
MLFKKRHHEEDKKETKIEVKEVESKDTQQKEVSAGIEKGVEELGKEIGKEIKHIETSQEVAPLFVKIEKYREVVANIQEIRILLNGIKNIFNLLYEIEHVRNDATKLLSTTLQRVERSLIELDTSLLRPGDFETSPTSDMSGIEQALSQLTQQLTILRNELEKTKGGTFKV